MDSPQEFNCIFCKETFQSKEELQIHFRKHGDPKFNQSTKNKARTNDTPGENSSEGVEMISCDVCTELFPTISKAITHKHKFHPDHDTKHFCPWCGKLFTMKHLYNKHISTTHENENIELREGEDFPCDFCDVTFHLSSAMLYHNKFFHRQDTDLPAIGHSKKLKMVHQCSLMIYYCPFCGQEYNNKVNLHKHMTDDHSDENQSPDDVLRCPLCDAIFYHLDAYEHHLSFHSIEDMYNENNEMADSVTEFSLESVPPIMERVENLEPEPKETSDGGAMGLDDLLLMAMGNSVDEDNPKKSKKHKKHKKSKKAAITLDEFLNMNKDVFGEGIDFQGIEEVPSQVVAKRFKIKKKAALLNSGSKMSAKEIEKLRKQGIVIKKKGATTLNKPIPTQVKQISNQSDIKANTQTQSTVKTSNEVLTKLMNQSNNQIKIVRKPAQNTSEANGVEDEKPSSPENIEVECDLIQRYTSSETEGEEKPEKNIDKFDDEVSDSNANKTKKNDNDTNAILKRDCNESNRNLQNNVLHNVTKNNEDLDLDDKSNNSNPLIALKNVSQHITVKPVIPTVKINSTPVLPHDVSTNVSNENPAELKQKGYSEIKDTNGEEVKDKPLNALKHLSHLITVKPVIPANTAQPHSPINSKEFSDEERTDNVPINSDDDNDNDISDSHINRQNDQPAITNKNMITPQLKQAPLKSLNTLKLVSNNVTIKPMMNKLQSSQTEMSHSSDEDEQMLNSVQRKPDNNQSTVRSVTLKQQNVVKSPASSPKINQSGIRKLPIKESSLTSIDGNTKSQSNIDLLKNLKNVTAKPISNSQSAQVNKSIQQPAYRKVEQIKQKEEINNEIEIFNIDDSDSDTPDNVSSSNTLFKENVSDIQKSNLNSNSMQAVKHLGKHLTIRSTYQKAPLVNIKPDPDQDKFTDLLQGDAEIKPEYPEDNKANINGNNKVLQNTLKNLSKHITIKSRNSSPSSVVSTYVNKNEDSNDKFDTNDFDSDNDSNSGRVKITEIDDEHVLPEKDDEFEEDFNDSALVQSPHYSDSDDDADYSQNKDFEDIESKIHANTVRRIETKHEESFKNVSKGITIKSLSDKKPQPHSEAAATTKAVASFPSNLSKEISIKPFKQSHEYESNVSQQSNKMNLQSTGKNSKSSGQQIARRTNQSTNQKVCMSKNQTNTVNKEVTVKTFQSKTVIQEITTTVTKTIKTVNQTMKQEVQTASQSCTQNVVRKVQGMIPQQQPIKNYQGVVVRHAAPVVMGTKVRNAMTPVRPTRPTNATNQLVPVRSATPMKPRMPRMPAIRSSIPSTSINSVKPVKISPTLVNTTMNKRPVASESSGPFSCFKKPKESLIPVSEMSSFNSREDESTSYAMSTQMNKSNVMNVTRSVKGNTVVSLTQMKSEVSSCSQQLDKLNNMSGLRVVKTSQVKHAFHAEEKQEVSPAKNVTLEAIQKLQKQGLLVKKPRLDTNEEDRYSEDDDGDGRCAQDEDMDDEDCFS